MNTNTLNWSDGLLNNFNIPSMNSASEASRYLKDHKKEFVWNTLSNFENITTTQAETKDIIEGKEINGIR